jgi:protein-S-isoprenylcysteine O-methyltransferase Ste14
MLGRRGGHGGRDPDKLMRIFLPLYLVVYLAAAFVWRSYLVWKTTGINPVTFKGTDTAHDFIGRLFKALFAFILLVVMVFAFLPKIYRFMLPIDWLDHVWIRWSGVALLVLSLLWTVVAQGQMGSSWRIGVDNEHPTQLVQHGLFSVSRNPIFVGMMITLAGLFMVIPNGVTLLTFVLGSVLIGIQVRLEEEHLKSVQGRAYEEYYASVRRWI